MSCRISAYLSEFSNTTTHFEGSIFKGVKFSIICMIITSEDHLEPELRINNNRSSPCSQVFSINRICLLCFERGGQQYCTYGRFFQIQSTSLMGVGGVGCVAIYRVLCSVSDDMCRICRNWNSRVFAHPSTAAIV